MTLDNNISVCWSSACVSILSDVPLLRHMLIAPAALAPGSPVKKEEPDKDKSIEPKDKAGLCYVGFSFCGRTAIC